MGWIKKTRILDPEKNSSTLVRNYASLPVCDLISDKLLRIYFSTRDNKGRSIPTFLDTNPCDPAEVYQINNQPILQLGNQGSFDDNGIMPSCIINHENKKYLYYIGWNPQITVSYRLSIGLAISYDNGRTYKKYSDGPILDRDLNEPYFNTAPYILKEGELWRMWYVSCTGWKNINNWPEPIYLIKYAESKDGIIWERKNIVCIGYNEFTHAIGKPCIYKYNKIYKMIYSYRNLYNYRTDPNKSYRLGYAESSDGLKWKRLDHEIDLKSDVQNWDDIMQEYGSTYLFNGVRYLIYNGNGFGKTGFGYAVKYD